MTDDKTQLILQNKFLKQSLSDVGKAFAKEREEKQALTQIIEKYKKLNNDTGACTMGEMRKDRESKGKQENQMTLEHANAWKEVWKARYEKEKKKNQELENEMVLVIGITVTNSPELRQANKKINELQSNLDRVKKENNDLYNRIAKITEPNLQKARESGL